ncbi:Peroxiredoxin [Aquimarina amphilecti]|uniref:Peroxiredoxin n=1 Tax=Aquimarina amphilecti TaxID=1038014 RepID=A0A1H7QTU2_AQUAM|nr:TlpA disulfide reductase family protein [Aquimarina amphilecti]SEL51299.1 Peroxiredoxin [Aquimarina amphilecti]
MKKLLLFTLVTLLLSCSKSDKTILDETIAKLNTLETIEYRAQVTFLPKKDDRNNIFEGNCFYDFTSKDSLLGAKYHFVMEDGDEQVFDGEKMFYTSVKEERVLYENDPKDYQVNSSILGLRSLLELKKVLPTLASDSTVILEKRVDTIINNVECRQFNFSIPDRYISDGKLVRVGKEMKDYIYNYEISISKNNKLPVYIRTSNSFADQVITAELSDFDMDAKRDSSVWSYERFPEGYLTMTEREYYKRERINMESNIGKKAPDFTLPSLAGDTISLSKLENKLTLLEFWFPNCGGCVEAVPHINEIQKRYKKNGLSIYGIEFTRSNDKGLRDYVEKQHIEIPTLYLGKGTASSYGTSAAPTFVLLNEQKEILYIRMGLEKETLIKMIETELGI